MIGNNACGSRALGYGRTADNVVGLEVAFGTGGLATRRLVRGRPAVGARSTHHLGHVRTQFGRFSRQVSGYSLEHLLPENGRRLDRFLVGSEGTLGGGPRGDRGAGAGRAAAAAGGAGLPVDGRGGRRGAGVGLDRLDPRAIRELRPSGTT